MNQKLSYELESSTQAELESLIDSCACNLYDIALVRENEMLILRISIMAKQGATTLEMCAKVSEIISPFLDVKDLIKEAYHLEVGSPGLERALKTHRHFALSVGAKVSVRTMDKTEFEAVILQASQDGVDFEILDFAQDFELDSMQDFALDFAYQNPMPKATKTNKRQNLAKKSNQSDSAKNDSAKKVHIPYNELKKVKTIFEW